MSLILVCFPGCSGGEGRKEGKRGNIGCERGERLAEEGKRTGGEENFLLVSLQSLP